MIRDKRDKIRKIVFKALIGLLATILTLLLMIGIVFVVHKIYPVEPMEKELIATNIGAGDVLSFVGGYFAFIGATILGYLTVKNSKESNEKIIELEEKNYIQENRLKLLSNDGTLEIVEDWTMDIAERVNGISQLYHNHQLEFDTCKNYIFNLKYDNFVPPVKLRVNKITIGRRPQDPGALSLVPYYFKNPSDHFTYGFISEPENQLIPISFTLKYNREDIEWLSDDTEGLTIKGEIDVLSNEDVISSYIFRFVYHQDILDNIRTTTKLTNTYIMKEFEE